MDKLVLLGQFFHGLGFLLLGVAAMWFVSGYQDKWPAPLKPVQLQG